MGLFTSPVEEQVPEMLASSDDHTANTASRRSLLRGGALAAGAVVATVAVPTPAQAADGDSVVLGAENEASTATTMRLSGAGAATSPSLSLANADGPALHLEASASWETPPVLALGQIANTILGPVIGVDHFAAGLITSYLATGVDLDDLPTPYALPTPVRLLDTRSAAKRGSILRASSHAFGRSHRLLPGQWMDIEVAVDDGAMDVPAAYLNVLAIPQSGGYLSVYPPGPFPGTSTINFAAKRVTSGGAFVATGIVLGRHAVRVRASASCHVVVDLTGVTIKGSSPAPAVKANGHSARRSNAPATGRRSRLAARMLRQLSR